MVKNKTKVVVKVKTKKAGDIHPGEYPVDPSLDQTVKMRLLENGNSNNRSKRFRQDKQPKPIRKKL